MWLAYQAFGILLRWQVAIPLSLLIIFAIWEDFIRPRKRPQGKHLLLFLPLLPLAVMLTVGHVYWEKPEHEWMVHTLAVLQLVTLFSVAILLKHTPVFTFAACMVAFIASFYCWFVCTMAVTGSWV
jgi:hypothetical protein